MRELTGHKVNPANDQIQITVLDDPGAGGANHDYVCVWPKGSLRVQFQNGPIAEVGVNGVTHEALLEILIDRLKSFQAGPYACDENRQALVSLEIASNALRQRTETRMKRGVEGTSTI